MKTCDNCKHENEDELTHCEKCNSIFILEERITNGLPTDKNKIASFIKIIAYLIISVGLILAFVLPYNTSYNGSYDYLLLIKILSITVIVVTLLLGFAEIISKLHISEIHQRKIIELLDNSNDEA